MATKMKLAELDLVDEPGPDTQKVAVLDEPERLSIRYAGIPDPEDDEIRVRVKWVGICGSDIEAYRGTREAEFVSFPTRLGHEVAGTVDKVGRNVHGIAQGDVVATRYVWGAFAEYIVCRPFNVKKVPSTIPPMEVSLIEVLPGVIHAAERSAINASKTVLIMGQGVSGLVLTQVFSQYSPKRLVVTDLKEKNLALARRYGATDTYILSSSEASTMDAIREEFPEGIDVVVPSLLEGDGIVDAVDAAAQNGKIVLYGCIGKTTKTIDLFKVHRKRLDILTTEPRRDVDMRRFFEESVRMVEDGLVNTGEMITHTFPLDRIQEAFDIRNEKNNDSIHVLVDCEVS